MCSSVAGNRSQAYCPSNVLPELFDDKNPRLMRQHALVHRFRTSFLLYNHDFVHMLVVTIDLWLDSVFASSELAILVVSNFSRNLVPLENLQKKTRTATARFLNRRGWLHRKGEKER